MKFKIRLEPFKHSHLFFILSSTLRHPIKQNIFSPSLDFISFNITSCCIVCINLEKYIKLLIQSLSLLYLNKSKFSTYIQLHSAVHTSNIFFISSFGVTNKLIFTISVQNKEQYSSNISL